MVSRVKALHGKKIGRLTVESLVGVEGTNAKWLCKCDCGSMVSVLGFSLSSGKTKSCGCLQKEKVAAISKTHGDSSGKAKTPEYTAWTNMIARCTRPTHKSFVDYGARGITVCDEWFSFEVFLRDMGRRPSDAHSIDRKNNDLGYSKENCRWATKTEQMQNTRRSKTYRSQS